MFFEGRGPFLSVAYHFVHILVDLPLKHIEVVLKISVFFFEVAKELICVG